MITDDEVMRLFEQADPARPHRRDHGDDGAVDAETPVLDLGPRSADSGPPRWMIRAALGAAAAVLIVAALAVVARRDHHDTPPVTTDIVLPPNGWVALTAGEESVGGWPAGDVYLVRAGGSPRRVAGSDTDRSYQNCPAFSPDGGRLAFGQVTIGPNGYEDDAELVIIEVAADGSTSGRTTIPAGDMRFTVEPPGGSLLGWGAPPCAIWSPDGRWLAFGAGNEVRLVDTVTGELRRLPGYHPSDLEWRPGTDELAITGTMDNEVDDAPISIYSVSTDNIRTVGDVRAANLTWSPDGTTLAFTHGEHTPDTGIWLVAADGSDERQLTERLGPVNHGIGVTWSPDGHYIAYQRIVAGRGESHEVVLVTADDDDPDAPLGNETVIPPPTTQNTDHSSESWYPRTVTWSPDGSTLLYNGWTECTACGSPGDDGGGGLLEVPLDPGRAPVILGDGEGQPVRQDGQPYLPIQAWGRQPPG